MQGQEVVATFYPLVAACKLHGIGRSTAYELAESGEIESFFIGSKRYVMLESLRALALRKLEVINKSRRTS